MHRQRKAPQPAWIKGVPGNLRWPEGSQYTHFGARVKRGAGGDFGGEAVGVDFPERLFKGESSRMREYFRISGQLLKNETLSGFDNHE